MTLTPVQQWALAQLVSPDALTGDDLVDLARAFGEIKRRRDENSALGQIIIEAAHEEARARDKGWDLVAEVFGEPRTNLRRWGARRPTQDPPGETEDSPDEDSS